MCCYNDVKNKIVVFYDDDERIAEAYSELFPGYIQRLVFDTSRCVLPKLKQKLIRKHYYDHLITFYVRTNEPTDKVIDALKEFLKELNKGFDLKNFHDTDRSGVSMYGNKKDFESMEAMLTEMGNDPDVGRKPVVCDDVVSTYIKENLIKEVNNILKKVEKEFVQELLGFECLVRHEFRK